MTRKLKGFVVIADIVIDYTKENIREFGEKGENRMNKTYKGWELIKAIADGEIKERNIY